MDGQAELAWVAGYMIPRWYACPKTVTHPSHNQAQRWATSLMETNALQLSQIDTNTNMSVRNTRWPRRMLHPGESRWLCRWDRQTDWRTPERYITLSAILGQRN